MNGVLATGSVGTGSWQREIPMALLIAIKVWENFASSVYGFLQNNLRLSPEKEKS